MAVLRGTKNRKSATDRLMQMLSPRHRYQHVVLQLQEFLHS